MSKNSNSVSVQWFDKGTQLNQKLGFNSTFNRAFAETCARRMNKYVPFRTGALSENYLTNSTDTEGTITYTQIYARRMYYGDGFNFNHEFHPLATSRWDKAMLSNEREQLTSEADEMRKRYAGK